MNNLSTAKEYINDAQSNVHVAIESLETALDEADCITMDDAILATVQDGVKGAIEEALSYLKDI